MRLEEPGHALTDNKNAMRTLAQVIVLGQRARVPGAGGAQEQQI